MSSQDTGSWTCPDRFSRFATGEVRGAEAFELTRAVERRLPGVDKRTVLVVEVGRQRQPRAGIAVLGGHADCRHLRTTIWSGLIARAIF
jgi:hypothetical protein